MLFRAAVGVSVLTFCGVRYASCGSESAPEIPLSAIDEVQSYNDDASLNIPLYDIRVPMPRPDGVVRYLDIIATTCVIFATLFFLVRCVAYISKVSRTTWERRRLAADNYCGDKVSTLRASCDVIA